MSNSKHTPGPWTIDETYGLITAENGAVEVAACHAGRGGDAKANARLIAAAPELLEFVMHVLHEQVAHGENGDAEYVALARALIAKATGGAE